MRKQELIKRWKELDKGCQALEFLQDEGYDEDGFFIQRVSFY